MSTIQQVHTFQEQKALDVFNRHVAAFTSGDLDKVVSDFSEQSVVFTPDGVFEGLDQIRSVYQALLAEFGVINRGDSPGIQIDTLLVRHDTLFITWHAESKHHRFGFATDTFVFNGDKVERQSISFAPPHPREAKANGG